MQLPHTQSGVLARLQSNITLLRYSEDPLVRPHAIVLLGERLKFEVQNQQSKCDT